MFVEKRKSFLFFFVIIDNLILCQASSSLPNVVLMFTDDQDLLLNSMQALPYTSEFLGDKNGANFTNFFAHTSVCCPSRGQILTGKYMHNLKADNASVSTCMRLNVDDLFYENTISNVFQKAGYETMMIGKYLNGNGHSKCPDSNNISIYTAPPVGWDKYFVMCPDTCYNDCFFGDNGYGHWFNNTEYSRGGNYAPSIIGNMSFQYINDAITRNKPFFAYIAPHSPHPPSTPAPWYKYTRVSDDPLVHSPSFNISAPDHHWIVAVQPKITIREELNMVDEAQNRLRTLLTIDDIVKDISLLLESKDVIDNTYFIFTSDHGYHMGQHQLGSCKRQPYDTDIRIPFLIRGPNIRGNQIISSLVGIPDIAPTLLDLVGINLSNLTMDGKSFKPLMLSSNSQSKTITNSLSLTNQQDVLSDVITSTLTWRDSYLIEYIATEEDPKGGSGSGHYTDNGNNTFRGLRVMNDEYDLAYFEFTDPYDDWNFNNPNFYELFNLTSDPDQMQNIYNEFQSTELVMELSKKLQKEYICSGASCS